MNEIRINLFYFPLGISKDNRKCLTNAVLRSGTELAIYLTKYFIYLAN